MINHNPLWMGILWFPCVFMPRYFFRCQRQGRGVIYIKYNVFRLNPIINRQCCSIGRSSYFHSTGIVLCTVNILEQCYIIFVDAAYIIRLPRSQFSRQRARGKDENGIACHKVVVCNLVGLFSFIYTFYGHF